MSFSEETLIAYADDELDAATRAAVEAAAAADPLLAQRIAQQRALRARLRAAFEPVLAEPVPERLLAAARGAPTRERADNVIEFQARPRPRWSWSQWGALAASLVLGVFLGPLLLRPAGAPVDTRGGRMLANVALSRALSEQLAGTAASAAPIEIGVSFRARSGAYCRTFVLREAGSLAGLACRERSAWQVLALAPAEGTSSAGGGYRQAASALPPPVARALDELIAGEPLDGAAEAAARAHGWKP
jgi:anti-sigma factor RsiW